MAHIIDGKAISALIKTQLADEITVMQREYGRKPGLAVVLVGDDPASASYVRSKHKTCEKLGILTKDYTYSTDVTQQHLFELVDQLNADQDIDGILIQLPLPSHIASDQLLMRIDPDKDVDGFHPVNIGKMVSGIPAFYPCTPYGILKLLEYSTIQTEGKHVCIVGRSNIVGKPIANMLLQKSSTGNATVTVCHSRTPDIALYTRQADIVIAAVGAPGMIDGSMLKEGAVVIDVGVNRVDDETRKRGYRLVGDVDFESAAEKASAITPVPGGVGPMTIAMLMYNTVVSAKRRVGMN
ncbi:MAG: bifunctional methylenetetrahydrofolate dehydrogenase/methenyltetrahydrofolate cyclohydrolase FolD [Spirochaetota bacterium]